MVARMLLSPAPVVPAGEERAFEVKWDRMSALVAAAVQTDGDDRFLEALIKGTNWGESQRTFLHRDH